MFTPMDIRNHTLKTSMSGYNKKDTEDFLNLISEDFDSLIKENRELKEKISSLNEGIQYYKQMENTLQKALVLAEKTSQETQEAAKTQAKTIINEANLKSEEIIQDAKIETDNMKNDAKEFVRESEEKADEIIKKARERADTIIKEAKQKANNFINEMNVEAENIKLQSQNEIDDIRADAVNLIQTYEKYHAQIKSIVLSQLEFLENEKNKLNNLEIEATKNNLESNLESNLENNLENKEVTIDKENFLWNSQQYSAASVEDANPFTFIDP